MKRLFSILFSGSAAGKKAALSTGVRKTVSGAYRYRYTPLLVSVYATELPEALALPLGELSPQVTERVLQSILNGEVNLRAHAVKIPVDLLVGESQNLQAERHQKFRTLRIIILSLRFIMLRTIHFDNQLCRSTVKINDEFADDPLLVDLHRYLRRNRYQSLRSCGVISLRSCRAFSNWQLSFDMVMFYPLRPRFARPPLPKGEARGAPNAPHRMVYRSAPLRFDRLVLVNPYRNRASSISSSVCPVSWKP